MKDALDQLARRCGIEPEYWDIWGNHRWVSDSTKLALLKAMGLSVEDEEAVRTELSKREARTWRRLLDPVLVIGETESPIQIVLRVPEARVDGRFEWILSDESGGRNSGFFVPAGLEKFERHDRNGESFVKCALPLSLAPGLGYHQLDVREVSGGSELSGTMRLIVTPKTCYLPPGLKEEGRVWGPAVQLYALRSKRNWGIGDFTDLRTLTECCAEVGAGIVGLNPLHAPFLGSPAQASPYSPSSRILLNVLYLDVEAIADLAECEQEKARVQSPEFQARLATLREMELVDYEEVAEAKLPILKGLYEHFRKQHLVPKSERGQSFRAFQARGGEALYAYGVFESLYEHFHRQDPDIWGWPVWPDAYRDPELEAVAEFASAHQEQVEFFQYLQWQADLQLGAVGRRSMELGLKVGLYEDLAVSVNAVGAETWVHQDLYALGARIGAPPDDFNLNGQDWGLPPLIPEKLIEAAYAPIIATLRANMRHGGALRIDHVMGLMRLFWVPPGKTPAEGAYVHYAFEDLLGILALESQRNRCLVIGEDLGTVPDEVRNALQPLGVLSYRLFYFERDPEGKMKAPQDYPAQALVAASTHDLPTLAGYWQGRDLVVRTELGLFPQESMRETQIVERAKNRARLRLALEREGVLPEGMEADPAPVPEMTPELVAAIHLYLARSPAKVLMVQLEDVLGQVDQVNLPGTVDEYPNWRRKLPLDLEDLAKDGRLKTLAEALRRERGPGSSPPDVGARRPARSRATIPVATYRLQLNKDFTFSRAADIVPYLRQLGISHCYASPYLKARPGSLHGYDIVDHSALNPEIGSPEAFEHFVQTVHQHGMGQILDCVPNHMAVGCDNDWWLDVLENGQASAYVSFFDIDWRPLKDELRGKVLLPILEDHYGSALEDGLLRLAFDAAGGQFSVLYHEHCFPVAPGTYALILGYGLERLEARLGATDPRYLEFQSLINAFQNLPRPQETQEEKVKARRRDKEVYKRHLSRLCADSQEIVRFLEENVIFFNGVEGETAGFDLLHRLLEAQTYRVAYWRVASDEINYRRFFDINALAGLKIENPQVFESTHRFVLELIAQGRIDGLRIDHPDGLYNPAKYYQRLQEGLYGEVVSAVRAPESSTTLLPEIRQGALSIYAVVEKILAGYEHLCQNWLVHGTTGYDFASLAGGLFVDSRAERAMERIYTRFVGSKTDFDELLYQSKILIMKVALASELNVLAHELDRISESDRHTRDFTLNKLKEALAEVVACFPVYRTYVTEEGVTEEDRRYVGWAVAQARKRSRAADTSIYDFIYDVLVLDVTKEKSEAYRDAVTAFAMKFQQYTSPVMAKGLEDTSFYIYNRLISLNEVGGDPRRFGVSVSAFHRANRERAKHWPHAMLNTCTHDSKRSEDIRARINVLSEIPGKWQDVVTRWSQLNRSKKRKIGPKLAPSKNDEYALYQTLIGAWPLGDVSDEGLASFRERIEGFMMKAVREAKVESSWINPNGEYEDAVLSFVRGLLNMDNDNRFIKEFLPFQKQISRFGMFNSLSQVLLKLTSPGVPDIYQGNELWAFSLVDPDNRRLVDYSRRQEMLCELKAFVSVPDEALANRAQDLVRTMEDGRIKLYLTWKTLNLRWERPQVFQDGEYLPLPAHGEKADRLCAFARAYEDIAVIVVVPRLYSGLCGWGLDRDPIGPLVWADTWIEAPTDSNGREYQDIFTEKRLSAEVREGKDVFLAERLLAHFPVALLVTV